MTDPDDKLSRRYRELAAEEPSARVDAAILAAARREVGAGPRARGGSWMVPVSIAAVLMLGIGVSLRMQVEQPGIETSAPASPAEYPVPSSAEPAPAARQQAPSPEPPPPAAAKAAPERKAKVSRDAGPREEHTRGAMTEREVAKPLSKETAPVAEAQSQASAGKDAAEPKPFADAPVTMQAPVPAAPPAAGAAAPAAAPAPQAAPALRAKREAVAADTAAARESRALGAVADPDPAREIERIAKLREAGRHEEADRALAQFRRRHPDYRIPEAMWERVKPR